MIATRKCEYCQKSPGRCGLCRGQGLITRKNQKESVCPDCSGERICKGCDGDSNKQIRERKDPYWVVFGDAPNKTVRKYPVRWVPLAMVLALLSLGASQEKLPSALDAKKAEASLVANPDDPAANLTVGRYLAFVQGDFDKANAYFQKGSDPVLKKLAQDEAVAKDAVDTEKVKMGDAWVQASGKMPGVYQRLARDRGAQWYTVAWNGLKGEPIWGDKLREQGLRVSQARPQGVTKKVMPKGWTVSPLGGGMSPVIDGTIAHSGSTSLKMIPSDPKVPGSFTMLVAEKIPIPQGSKTISISAYVRTDGTESKADQVFANVFDATGKGIGTVGPKVTEDVPFWKRYEDVQNIPDQAASVQFGVIMNSRKGNMWVDDVSMTFDGKTELLKNTSFDN